MKVIYDRVHPTGEAIHWVYFYRFHDARPVQELQPDPLWEGLPPSRGYLSKDVRPMIGPFRYLLNFYQPECLGCLFRFFEVSGHVVAFGLVGAGYLVYYQLGVTLKGQKLSPQFFGHFQSS